MREAYYNVHDFLQVQISQDQLDLVTNYDHYFRHFKVGVKPKEVHYQICEFCEFQLPTTYFVSDAIIGLENGLCLPQEEYALVLDGNKITEYSNVANKATNLWLQYLLVDREMSVVHSAGIELDGKGIIFPGLGGVGKTLLVSELRKLVGSKFFGDDYVIVDRNSNMLCYPSDFSIYDYHLDMFPELRNTPFQDYLEERRRKQRYQRILSLIPGRRLVGNTLRYAKSLFAKPASNRPVAVWDLDYVKVPVANLIPKERIGRRTKLFAGMFLSRYTGGELAIDEISLERLIREITGVLSVEFRYGLIYLHLLSAFGVIDLSRFKAMQRQTLQECFSRIKLYRVSIPVDIDPTKYCEELIGFIANIVRG